MSQLLDKIAEVTKFEDSGYVAGSGERWSAKLLYSEAEKQKCRPEKFPLKFVDYSDQPWDGSRLCEFIYHARRIYNADKTIPIIIGPMGGILDGFHRIGKALLDGDDHVMCYRLVDMPEPDGKNDE